ncbi:MAG: DUF3999 family protein [Ideonella sp.]|nr:DUF3999 family protein [Ideonella sp.]
MKKTTVHTAALLACFISTAVGATPGSAPLQLSGPGPYYRVTLPAGLYPLAQDAELSDLRVRSAQGSPLPWAWADATGEAPPAVQRHTVPLFPLPTATTTPQTTDAALLLLQVRPDGTLAWRKPQAHQTTSREWVIDTHAARGNLLSLALTLDPQAEGLFSLSLEHSDDLRTWHMAQPQATVAQLQHQGQSLQQNEIDLGGLRARYLRLRWLGDGPAPGVRGAEIQAYEHLLPSPPPLQWQTATAPACDATACTWRLPAHLPLDAVRLSLAQPNTVATVSLLGETDVTLAASPKRHHRLFARHRDSAQVSPPSQGMQRQTLLNTTLYRLSLPGQPERSNPELSLDGSPYTRLRLEARHSTQEWGNQPPQLSLGSRSRDIVVLARDAANVNISWGDPKATGIPMPLAQLMPLGAAQATGNGSVASLPAAAPPPSPAAQTTAAAASTKPKEGTPWLWAALVGGLLLLGGMAYSLLRGMKAKA